ncbi:glycosyl transferase [Mycolicibacterium anyangense]|uniref:Glycosyl transferase n=1 Tax=Mycolicibacterium anyangense TaxID=1431246 RepID=A0A6N4WDE4_9MYCO|nr:glycosyltransferase family 39 protein [Mycolicibacterium anyangense]BBZ78237.1 glycosyl transferase [Mycolicibacterium anyangense]
MTVLEDVVVPEYAEVNSTARRRWVRPALCALLAATAVLYLWGLGAAGWANEYYAAAVQAGTQSWKALLFGSIDSGNAITVDKPPAALWVMALSGRIFGFSTWSMLAPQALMGVASVALVYGAVRRVSGYRAGLLAGAVLALTPVAALMFRYNNPDALLVLLLVAAGYCLIRALDGAASRWVALAGVAVGVAFLAKLLQALLVTPALALVVLVALPGTGWHRLRVLLVGLVSMIVSAGWYLALVSLWPADSRPYIGGSTDNSLLQLALGYNGLGRVFGGDGNPGGSGGPTEGAGPMAGSAMFGGSTGITRMFGDSMGTEISWLLPAALIGLAAGLWFTRRAPRTDRTRAALLLWGGWLVVTVVVFSFMKGIMHPYYTVALAPAVAAVIGLSVRELWRGKQFSMPRWTLAAMLAVTGIWNFVLLERTPDWLPWLRWAIVVGAVVVAAVLAAGGHRLGRWTAVLAAAGLLVGLAGTSAYSIETVLNSHSGGIPTSGPSRPGTGFGPGGPGGFGAGGGSRGGVSPAVNTELQKLLKQSGNRWAAATVGSHVAGSLELATGASVMSIGGFNGGDNSPTLQQFQDYVSSGQVHYFIVSEGPGGHGGGPGHGSSSGSAIISWVQQHFSAQDIGGTEVYDLTAG